MTRDHGTLRDSNGKPIAYRVLVPGLRNIPLMESQVWPDDMTDREARSYTAIVERDSSQRIGSILCEGDHSECEPDADGHHAFTCVYCGAAR